MRTAPDWLARAAAARPEHPALVADGDRLSFAALDAEATAMAARLRGAGLGDAERVGVVLPNGRLLATLVHAAPRAGIVLALLDPRATPDELGRLARRAGVSTLLAAADTVATARASGVAVLRADTLAPARRVTSPTSIALHRPHSVVFTSGSSGDPKPVVLSAGNHLWSALGSAARLGVSPDDRWLCCLPCWHVGGLAILLRGAILASTVVIQPRFVLDAVMSAVDAEGITMLSLVPTALARVAAYRAPASLRVALVGGAAASADVLATAAAHGWPAAPTYGCTEAASQVATAVPGSAHALAGSVGVPLGPTRVRIVDERGRVLPAESDGLVEIGGPTVALGVATPDGGLAPLAQRGWLRTSDVGRLAADGALIVRGRRDDVIVTGGENVAPTEVEHVLAALPGVAEVAVAGVPDAEWGHAVAAWVVPQPGATIVLDELRAAARTRLAAHKLPKRLYVVDALPRTAAGKVRRAALRVPTRASRERVHGQ